MIDTATKRKAIRRVMSRETGQLLLTYRKNIVGTSRRMVELDTGLFAQTLLRYEHGIAEVSLTDLIVLMDFYEQRSDVLLLQLCRFYIYLNEHCSTEEEIENARLGDDVRFLAQISHENALRNAPELEALLASLDDNKSAE